MLVEFSAAGLVGHGPDFRDGEEDVFSHPADIVGFLQRNSRQGADIDGERALIESREEAAAEGAEHGNRCRKQDCDSPENRLAVGQCPGQCLLIPLPEPPDPDALLPVYRIVWNIRK